MKFSHPSSRRQYESGLQYVASDTICFPAKLVHGHVLDLSKQGGDRIFLPYILHMPTENKGEKSPYVCPVIMGYSTPNTAWMAAVSQASFMWVPVPWALM